MSRTPRVSVILVNYKGIDDTLTAVEHLSNLAEFPRDLEIVVVDNASGDDSVTPQAPRPCSLCHFAGLLCLCLH